MKKFLLTLTLIIPFFTHADIICEEHKFINPMETFSITNASTKPFVSWRYADNFGNLESAIKVAFPQINEKIIAVEFTIEKSECLLATAEPLLHLCGIGRMGDLSKLENIKITLASGNTLNLKAIVRVVSGITRNLGFQPKPNPTAPVEIQTFESVTAGVNLELHIPGSPTLYARIDKENNFIGCKAN